MNDRPFHSAAQHSIIPFTCGIIFFLLVMGTTLAIGFLSSDYSLPNDALDVAGAETLGYVFLAATLGETMFGWKKKTGSRFDWIADLAHTLTQNVYFVLGIAFGFCLLGINLAYVGEMEPHTAVEVVAVMVMICVITVSYEVLRDHIRREYCSSRSTLIFFLFSLLALGLLWWNA